MSQKAQTKTEPLIEVQIAERLSGAELNDLCDATEAAIADGGGFGWLSDPGREALERYWKGVTLIPDRTLVVARVDGVICGSTQLVRPPRHNEARAFMCELQSAFVAPWARGHGLAKALVEEAELIARGEGRTVINLDLRETQLAAIALYESMGYVCWGTNPNYARVDGRMVAGRFYTKTLD